MFHKETLTKPPSYRREYMLGWALELSSQIKGISLFERHIGKGIRDWGWMFRVPNHGVNRGSLYDDWWVSNQQILQLRLTVTSVRGGPDVITGLCINIRWRTRLGPTSLMRQWTSEDNTRVRACLLWHVCVSGRLVSLCIHALSYCDLWVLGATKLRKLWGVCGIIGYMLRASEWLSTILSLLGAWITRNHEEKVMFGYSRGLYPPATWFWSSPISLLSSFCSVW